MTKYSNGNNIAVNNDAAVSNNISPIIKAGSGNEQKTGTFNGATSKPFLFFH